MSTHRGAQFPAKDYIDPAPLPKSIPHVDEIGVTSAPLKSASFFIGEQCKDYNEDFMLCKAESRDPEHCLKEGRKVTRCAQDL
ncbi:NADH dehydrogenase (ubiquinone) 1 alpha subcomplex subunit 8, partial [Phenoliferia sp. Uapishka_3]